MEKPPKLLRVSKEWTPPTVAIAVIIGVVRMWTEPSPAQSAMIAANDVRTTEMFAASARHDKDIDKLTSLYADMDARQRLDKDETLKLLYQVANSVSRIEGKLDGK